MTAVLLYASAYLVLFAFTDLLYHRLRVHVEHTRKVVHVSTGVLALTFPTVLDAFWQVAALCGSFLVLMYVSEQRRWFPSITAVERRSYGSWLFALVVFCCFGIQLYWGSPLFYYAPLLVLTLADPAAALLGKRLAFVPYHIGGHTKSVGGSLVFLGISFVIIWLSLAAFGGVPSVWRCGTIALLLAATEGLSSDGWDNLTVPLTTVACLHWLGGV